MARYAPLPIVSIDPRNEAQLVQLASQTVYESSNRTLNDFSAGNPLAVLLEGQAFAQGEFLFWANQLPNKILVEWIGPFLGAMRRLGTPSVAQLELTISPKNTATTITAGTSFTTNPQLTGGVSLAFVSGSDLIIPAGESKGKVSVYSKYVGTANNVPAFSITGSSSSGGTNYSVINPQPAAGGSDVETYQEVQERFFSLIRRRNPVSESDWQNFFIDLYGVGTLTSVQPNRSSAYQYNYLRDYILPNGEVSFFVLGPGGIELTDEQLKLGQNAVNFSVPVENQGHLFPITLSQVQYNLTVEVEANGTFGANFKESSLNFRDRLYVVLTPGTTFPADINPTVSDVDAAFYSTFDGTTRFRDPLITQSIAYNTPNSLSRESATYTQVYEFEPTEQLLNENDLIVVTKPNPTFYPVESSFTPYSSDKLDQTLYNNLSLKQIKMLTPGTYSLGDIVYYSGTPDDPQNGLHVVLENLNIGSSSDILPAFASGKISIVKTYEPWIVGNSYNYTTSGAINPDIIEYDYLAREFLPATPSSVPLNMRPGGFAWLVTNNFTLQPPTNNITGAQAEFKVGSSVIPNTLEPGTSYTAGTWVCTPQLGSGPNSLVDPYYNYVDITKGALVKYAYVNTSFTYFPNGLLVSDYFNSLVTQGIVKEVPVFNGDSGLPVYKYKARFDTGQYLEYRLTSDSEPNYYIAAEYFSPVSTNIQELLNEGSVYSLTPTPELKDQFITEQYSGVPGKLASVVVSDPGSGSYTDGSYASVPLEHSDLTIGFNATLNITVIGGYVASASINTAGQNYKVGDVLSFNNSYVGGSGSGAAITVVSLVPAYESPLKESQRMFTFFEGDRTFFREGTDVRSYTATSAVTPLFEFNVYYESGVFVETGSESSYLVPSSEYIPYYNPAYSLTAEDTVISEDGRNLYRVTKAFTPSTTITNWTGMVEPNTTRYEEYAGNLLRYVSVYSCNEPILPQSGKETSSIKLGVAQITIIPRNTGRNSNSFPNVTYVWENTASYNEVPQLSWYTTSTFIFSPPNYRNGTLAL